MSFSEWSKHVAGTAREHLGVAAVSLGVIVSLGVVALGSFAGCRKQDTVAMADTFPAEAVSPSSTVAPAKKQPAEESIIVYVTGAVKRPGVYTLPNAARLYHAIRAAGGFKPNAVTDALNLADRAQDGDQLCIPSRKSPKVALPLQHTASLAPQRTRIVAPPPVIRKISLPAPVTLPPPVVDETAPVVTIIATPAPPGRVLGVPTPITGETSPSPTAEVLPTPPSLTGSEVITLPTTPRKSVNFPICAR